MMQEKALRSVHELKIYTELYYGMSAYFNFKGFFFIHLSVDLNVVE
jgi:hypothetical protein